MNIKNTISTGAEDHFTRVRVEAVFIKNGIQCAAGVQRILTVFPTFLLILIATSTARAQCIPAPSGLVSWWRGEGSGSDSFGSNGGTVVGAMSYRPGRFGQAFNITVNSQRVTVPPSASLDIGPGSGLTFEGWINPAHTNSQLPIIEFSDASGQGLHLWSSVSFSGFGGPGALYAGMRGGPLEGIVATRPGILTPNTWQHVALTYDSASRLARLYLNGVEMTNRVIAASVGSPLTTPALNIGHRPGSIFVFRGLLDELALYQRALSPAEIVSVFNDGKCIPQSPPPNGPGYAFRLDGAHTYLSATPSTLPTGDSPYTIEAWINPNSMHVGAIAAWGNYGVNNQVNALVLTQTGLNNYWWANDLASAPTANLAGTWHHVAATFDGTTRRILLDGAVIGSDTPVGHDAVTNNFRIGLANAGQYFNGRIDEVRIWNIGRTAAQIQQAMRRQLFGNESGLVACYRLDEGMGESFFDSTGNSNNTATLAFGQLASGPVWFRSDITPFAPTVTTQPLTSYMPTSATLNGDVVPNGAPTTTSFQWGPTTSFGSTTAGFNAGNGSTLTNWSQALSGLAPGQLAAARALATNLHGASYGLTTRIVQNTNDNGPGSLRRTVQEAQAGDRIVFAPGVTGTIVLTNGEIFISRNLTIEGPGAKNLAVSGNQSSRVFHFFNCAVSLSDITVANGTVSGAGSTGGGIVVDSANAKIKRCVITANTAGSGGGISSWGSAELEGCTINGNVANDNLGGGGGIVNAGDMTLVNSTLFGNASYTVFGGGGIWNQRLLTLVNCTISGNFGGFLGGGLYNQDTTYTVNSIIAQNSVDFQFGLGPDVLAIAGIGSGRPVTSLGHNFVGSGGDNNGWIGSDRVGFAVNPFNAFLAPLADNGGPTPTMALLVSSPAIDAGDNSVLDPPRSLSTDQRGLPRQSGGQVDIGAYEWEGYILGRKIDPPAGVIVPPEGPKIEPPHAAYWHLKSKTLYATAAGIPYTMTWVYTIGPNTFTNVVNARNSWPANEAEYQIHVANSPPVDLAIAGPLPTFKVLDQEPGVEVDATGVLLNHRFTATGPGRSLLMVSAAEPSTTNIYFQSIRTVTWDDPRHLVDRQPAAIGQAIQPQAGWHNTNFGEPFVFFPLSRYCAQPDYYDRTNRTGPIIPVNRDLPSTYTDDMVLIYYEQGAKLFNPTNSQLIAGSTGWPYKPVRYDCQWPVGADRIVIASQLGGQLAGLSNPGVYVQSDPGQPGYNPNEEHAFLFNQIGREPQLLVDYSDVTVVEGSVTVVGVSLDRQPTTNVLVSVAGLRGGSDGLFASFSPTGLVSETIFTIQNWVTPKSLYFTASMNADASESVNGTNLFTLRASGGLFDQKQVLVREADTNRLALAIDALRFSLPEYSSRSFAVRLTQPPPGPVTVTLSAVPGSDADVGFEPPTMSFTVLDWNVPQTVRVTAAPDSDSGDDTATIEIRASGGLTQTNQVVVAVLDKDSPPQAVYALRDDLGDRHGAPVPVYSEPYVLVTYRNGENRPGIRVFRVVAEEAPYFFNYANNFAGRLVQPPYPLSQLPGWEANTYAFSGPWWQDRKKFFWARSAGDNGGSTNIVMKFFYPRNFRSDFFFPPGYPASPNVPWLDRRLGGTPGTPTDVTYQILWPDDVPELRVGESLVKAKFGLPSIKGQTSVDIIYEQSAAQGFGAQSSIKLIDPEYTYNASLLALPPDTAGKTVTNLLGGGLVAPGSVFFTVLPPQLRSRLWWEPPPSSRLRFTGRFVPEFGTEEPVGFLLLNVITARDLQAFDLISADPAFRNLLRNDLASSAKAGQVKLVPSNTVQTASASFSDTFALTAGLASRSGYVTVAFNNVVNSVQGLPPDRGSPVSLQLIKVTCPLYRGEAKAIYPDDPFSETTALRHSGDFAGQADGYLFEWQYHQGPGMPPANSVNWINWTNGFGALDMVAAGSGSRVLNDWWYRCRWRTTNTLNPCGTTYTAWTDPVLVEGWIKRVLANINFFNQRYTNLVNSSVDTLVNVISQAGTRWVGQVPLNAEALKNSAEFGLIEIYETILKRGIELTIEGTPPQGSANQPLLQVAAQLANIYMLLGNEAYADAADATIGFVTTGGQYGVEATSVHCFMDQTSSLLDEELALLRGLDSTFGRDTRRHPIYNRLPPNMGSSFQAEPAYVLHYGIKDQTGEGTINALDAQKTYPQGHGDAWGHYLTAINNFYRLLANPVFGWTTEVEFVKLAGGLGDVPVNYQHERKFAQVAAAKARTGAEIVNLTYRNKYVDNPDGQWLGYPDSDSERAWGLSDWASRAGQGAYLDWVTANALLPSQSPGVGLAKVDRTTVAELREIAGGFVSIQSELDKADAGLNPLGLSKNVIPFDIDPARADAGETHFEQIQQRAVRAMNNAIGVFNHANASTQKLREQSDEVNKFTLNVQDRENDYTNRLIEVFGYPYPDDPTYAGNANVPDLVHYMYNDYSEITGELTSAPLQIEAPLVTFDVGADGQLRATTNAEPYHVSPNQLGLTKPLNWTRPRRAPGELQMVQSELIQSTARLKRAIAEYEVLLNSVEDRVDLLKAQHDINAEELRVLNEGDRLQQGLNSKITQWRGLQLFAQLGAKLAILTSQATAEAAPKVVGAFGGTASGAIGDPSGAARAGALTAGAWVSEGLSQTANGLSLVELGHQHAKEEAATAQTIKLVEFKQRGEAAAKIAELEQLVRQEVLQRLDLYNLREALLQSCSRYSATLAKGQRLMEERLRFRQQTASLVQGYRYKDMAFRIFRDEALQQYRAQFDSAAMYVYLAAAAYDFETNLRDAETRWRPGSSLLTDIVRARSLGVIDGAGNPQPGPGPGRRGDGGLAAALYAMNFNWSESQRPLRSQLGFNNPARENLTFSLRSGLFRSLTNDAGSANWRAWLASYVVPDVGVIPEFVRYCKPPNQFGQNRRAEPGIVIPFSSAILYGHNFFGWPEAGGGGNFSASYFTTKIKSTAVRFLGYDASHLTTTPHVYLVPVGNDVMLSPITLGFEVAPTREWKILDQFLPTPPNYGNISAISATLTNNPGWIPIAQLGTSDEPFLTIRRFAQMRAYHDGGVNGTPTNPELEAYKRLIGRSAWNTRWLLIILGGDLLGANPDRGVQTFINGYLGDGEGVSDIEVQYSTYSYPGN